MAIYTVTETFHYGNVRQERTASGHFLSDAITELITTPNAPYSTLNAALDIIGAFTGHGAYDALKPSIEFGWATYRLTITPEASD